MSQNIDKQQKVVYNNNVGTPMTVAPADLVKK